VNLVENAIRYGGSAEITDEEHGNDRVIMVNDNGPSIAEALLDKVFNPFSVWRTHVRSIPVERGSVSVSHATSRAPMAGI
jgi:signal transduction histidine kinase